MNMNIYSTPLSSQMLEKYRAFLDMCGLRDEEDADLIAWMTDDEDALIATGALAGHTIKQLAVSPDAEGQGVMATIISALISEAAAQGIFRLFLCTKPTNQRMFNSLGFYEVVSTPDALLMENRRDGAKSFIASLPRYKGKCGAIVCNCDPFTLGHRHLIEQAAAACDALYVFAVSESGSTFSPEDRLEMIRQGTADLPNCHVFASDLYLISRVTFPAYFIKDKAQAEMVKADLDIEFFAGKIAPALGITKRFVGEEPLDPVTAEYNKRLKALLPERGIALVEIPRLADQTGEVISASRVRNLLKEVKEHEELQKSKESQAPNPAAVTSSAADLLSQIQALVPQTTYDIILEKI